MTFEEFLSKEKMSKYKLAKLSGVPYSTLSDICSKKSAIKKCSVETVMKISEVFGMTVEELVAVTDDSVKEEKDDIGYFKEETKKRVEASGELAFLVSNMKNREVEKLYQSGKKKESGYLLMLLDDLCVKYKFPITKEFDYIRKTK